MYWGSFKDLISSAPGWPYVYVLLLCLAWSPDRSEKHSTGLCALHSSLNHLLARTVERASRGRPIMAEQAKPSAGR